MGSILVKLNELQLIFILIGVITGYQISFYFINQFRKIKSEHLGLNKLLLAYGVFFILGLTGIFIRNINHYYIGDSYQTEIFFKITNLIFISSIMGFLGLISSQNFSLIVKPRITKAFCLLLVIPFISIFFFQTGSSISNLIMGVSVIGMFYMLYFQFKLIKLSVGIIKKRLILILIGMLLILGSFLVGGELSRNIVLQENQELVIFFTSLLVIITFFIVFLGIYKFPTFLEFDWKKNLVKLFIIDREVVRGIYSYDFSKDSVNMKQTPDEKLLSEDKDKVLSVGIIGINEMISTFTSTEEKKIESISQGTNQIIFTYGDNPNNFIIYALLIKEDMDSLRYFLETIKSQFQGFFKGLLQDIISIRGNEEEIFSTFDIVLKSLIR